MFRIALAMVAGSVLSLGVHGFEGWYGPGHLRGGDLEEWLARVLEEHPPGTVFLSEPHSGARLQLTPQGEAVELRCSRNRRGVQLGGAESAELPPMPSGWRLERLRDGVSRLALPLGDSRTLAAWLDRVLTTFYGAPVDYSLELDVVPPTSLSALLEASSAAPPPMPSNYSQR